MATEIITKEDLIVFRHELLEDLKRIFGNPQAAPKEWLKSPEVRKLLNISPGTLQNLRINGTLRFTRLGSIIYYSRQDIEKILQANAVDNSAGTKQQKMKGL